MADILATILPRPLDMGAFGDNYPQVFIVPPQILLCSEKFVLNIW